ncbi:dihydroorotate dehydrogenase electron transfer subunit [Myxococcota bacterium]|nr:dihydroorotate dehydrogenase electron transfer subunit [Myxococcota bacterium]
MAQSPAGPRDMATPPLHPPIRADGTVVEVRHEGGSNRRISLLVPGWPGSEPGQFAMLSPGARSAVPRTDPLLPRPMAVFRSQATDDGHLVEFLFKVTGRGTALMAEALTGQVVGVVGPLGRPFPRVPEAGACVLVGGGTGIASLYALAIREAPTAMLLLGAGSRDDLMGVEDFEAVDDLEIRIATEDGSRGEQGLVTQLLERVLDEAQSPPPTVFSCGPTPMMARVAEIAAARGATCWASLENNMACGFGVCLGCAAPIRAGGYALVCNTGPVFEASTVTWEAMP